MNMHLFRLGAFGVLVLLLAGCKKVREEKVILLQTGRMAGNVYPLDVRATAPLQHYPYLAGYVKNLRQEAAVSGHPVVLIDSGDSLSGSFASYVTGSRNMITLFNTVGYDALFLGNLDANITPEVIDQIQAPILSPFLKPDGSLVLPEAPPVLDLSLANFTLRFFANFYGETSWEENPTRFPMWFGPVPTGVRPVRDYTAFVPKAAPADLNIFHWMKFDVSEPSADLLERLNELGIDAIAAHRTYAGKGVSQWKTSDFSGWPVPVSENILQINRGFTLARIDLIRKGGRWTTAGPHQLIQLTANTAQADPEIVAAIDPFAQAITDADKSLGVLPRSVSELEILKGYMSLLAETPEADAVFYSLDSIRSPLAKGPLSASRLYLSLPWTTHVEILKLSRDQVLDLTNIERTVLLKREDLPESCTLITSKFFARLIQQHLGLPLRNEPAEWADNEFQFFVDQLTSRSPEAVFGQEPEGWKFLGL